MSCDCIKKSQFQRFITEVFVKQEQVANEEMLKWTSKKPIFNLFINFQNMFDVTLTEQ